MQVARDAATLTDLPSTCVLQVDRYKQLLLKQRDIMIALTARLNERDEQINSLQVRWGRAQTDAC